MKIKIHSFKISLYVSAFCIMMLLAGIACNGGNNVAKRGNAKAETDSTTKGGEKVSGDTARQTNARIPVEKKRIVFFGNSLTAGYGVEPGEAYPSLIQGKLDSLALPYIVVNAGISGETTADGRNRISWVLQGQTDIFVLELGGNDGLRGIPLTETRKNLQVIIDSVKNKYPAARILITGMEVPPNMGKQYTSEFRHLYRELADKNKTELVPFLLEGVGGEPDLNQKDGIHPNVEGHRMVSETVWKTLKELL